MVNLDINFLIGCIGAVAPEAWRLYNLRTQAVFRWSWGYLLFSIPFILLGGFIAWILEPTSKWAAFYSGLTAPVLLTTAMKDTAQAQKELEDIESKLNKSQLEREQLAEEKQKLQETIEELHQKLNPQDKEIFKTELNVQHSYKSCEDDEDGIDIKRLKRRNKNSGSNMSDSETKMYSINLIYLQLTTLIIGIAMTVFWSYIFDLIRIFFFVLLGVIALGTIIFLLKNLQQNRNFKEFLKGL